MNYLETSFEKLKQDFMDTKVLSETITFDDDEIKHFSKNEVSSFLWSKSPQFKSYAKEQLKMFMNSSLEEELVSSYYSSHLSGLKELVFLEESFSEFFLLEMAFFSLLSEKIKAPFWIKKISICEKGLSFIPSWSFLSLLKEESKKDFLLVKENKDIICKNIKHLDKSHFDLYQSLCRLFHLNSASEPSLYYDLSFLDLMVKKSSSLQEMGSKSQKDGELFEKAFLSELNTKGSFLYLKIKAFIEKDKNISIKEMTAINSGKEMVEGVFGNKVNNKTDILLSCLTSKGEKLRFNFSLKKNSQRTQVHITTIKSFTEILKYKANISSKEEAMFLQLMSLFLGSCEKRKHLTEFLETELDFLKSFFKKYSKEITQVCCISGSMKDEKNYVDYFVYNNNSFTAENPLVDVSIQNVSEVYAKNQSFSFGSSGGTIRLGTLEVQRKGSSGKDQLQIHSSLG